MTTEIQTQPQINDGIAEHYLFEKRLHKTCRGVLKEKGNLYSIRYICSNPICPNNNRIIPLDEIVLTFEEAKRIDEGVAENV